MSNIYVVTGIRGPIVSYIDSDTLREWLSNVSPSLRPWIQLWSVPLGKHKNWSERLDIEEFINGTIR